MLNVINSFWQNKPEVIAALKERDRPTIVSSLAESDIEQKFGPKADALLGVEAQRDQHRACAQQLPAVKKQVVALQQKIADEAQAKKARDAEYDRAIAILLDERAKLERLQSKLEISARWLVTHVPVDVQARLDLLTSESVELSQSIAQYKEIESGLRRTAERTVQRIERLQNGHTKDLENTKSDIAQEQVIVANATRRADEQAAAISVESAKLATITLEVDTILARIKRGE